MKICVYSISKNEGQFVERFCNSAKDADLILIADTGSEDDTVSRGRAAGAEVHEISIKPWRFDRARDAALALIPEDFDVCISLDLDEVLEPGWREEIERVWTPQTTRLGYMFDWGCGIVFRYEKIHHRHGYHWWHPVHEYPRPDDPTKEVWAETPKLLVSHHPDPTKSRGQYLPLLELSVEEDPECPRNSFYLCREYSFYSRWADAIREGNRYLALPRATWVNERCYAYRVMGQSYSELGDWLEAEKHLLRACAEAPQTREPWCELAMLYYRQARWPQCYAASISALAIERRDWVYTANPAVWGHWAHDLASIAAWNMGLYKEAVVQAELAVKHSPNDQRLIANLSLVQSYSPEPGKLVVSQHGGNEPSNL